ncbi:MAG: sigma-54 dependent transcriptional regulator [Gammaproteobacteria bacterium]|jgi:DNA-binding NtrC family response regulator
MKSILIIEDEAVIRSALSKFLKRKNFEVSEAGSLEEALENNNLSHFNLILTDVRLPGKSGTELLNYSGDIPVIIMTAYSSVQSAVKAMQMGARDYIEKPFDHGELLRLIEKHILPESARSTSETNAVEKSMIGSSSSIKEIRSQVAKIAPTDATVLILGESGTGKELLARQIHAQSKRKHHPFIIFNCAAIPQNTIEDTLFGTSTQNNNGLISQASLGTLFLDEVGELPLQAQAKLLHLLQGDSQNNNDVRILAATHRNIRQLAEEGTFRNDLYFRIRVMEITLPPLRDREDDVTELSLYWLDRFKQQIDKPDLQLTRSSLEAIRRYNWPGNVRELGNAIERAAILAEGNDITPELLAIDRPVQNAMSKGAMNDNLSLEEYFRCFVLEHQNKMTETELAKKLGISRKALWERRQRFGLPRPKKQN